MTLQPCAREGCRNLAKGDDYCSRDCYIHRAEPRDHKKESAEARKRRLRVKTLQKKYGSADVEVATADAMNRRALGSFESGKRR